MKLDSTPDRFVITGGSPLRGEIAVKGAKNLVTKAMVASMLGNSQSVLTNVPNISDVLIVRRLMEAYNVSVRATQNDTLVIDPILLGQCSRGDIDVYAGSSRVPILFAVRYFIKQDRHLLLAWAVAGLGNDQLIFIYKP